MNQFTFSFGAGRRELTAISIRNHTIYVPKEPRGGDQIQVSPDAMICWSGVWGIVYVAPSLSLEVELVDILNGKKP